MALPVDLLETMIAKTFFAVSLDTSRPHVNSLLIKFGKATLTVVATDGHRLAKAVSAFAGAPEDEWLVPYDAVSRLRDFLGNVPKAKRKAGDEAAPGPATVNVQRDKTTVFFTSGERTFSFKLVDSQFPPYDQVIPVRESPLIVAPREALIGVIKAVAIAAGKSGGVKIACDGGKLVASVEDPERGKASDEVPIETKDSKRRQAGVNSKYLTDAFGAVDTDQVSLAMDDELDPILIRPVGETAVQLDLVVMPMRI
jgi:DNA polymerase-3 subunit beta